MHTSELTVTITQPTSCDTVPQCHDNPDVLRPELMDSPGRVGERGKLGAVEMNWSILTVTQLHSHTQGDSCQQQWKQD